MDKEIFALIEKYFESKNEEFIPGITKVRVGTASIRSEEAINCLDSLLTGWISQGKKVKEFERYLQSMLEQNML